MESTRPATDFSSHLAGKSTGHGIPPRRKPGALLSPVLHLREKQTLACKAVVILVFLSAFTVTGCYFLGYEKDNPNRPSPPTNLTATRVDSGIVLNWSEPEDFNGGVFGYKILRLGPGDERLTTLVEDTGSVATMYTDTSATVIGGRYRYRVHAIGLDSVLSPWSLSASMTLVEPTPDH